MQKEHRELKRFLERRGIKVRSVEPGGAHYRFWLSFEEAEIFVVVSCSPSRFHLTSIAQEVKRLFKSKGVLIPT